ncbi:DUF3263 domain-containing protein [Glycomyces albidus]|uniref:DUF3263 domain-containing protein n=1 Tax=Glycomyces albidus TaxID=2656774 RepID=A0A6L5GFQ6_9ACTN|nr:DUF3263 domain-containing protein [Glycomyces albidus]MQM28411.1 DUF3263 domain-containing protein [Glycomyces albidus]
MPPGQRPASRVTRTRQEDEEAFAPQRPFSGPDGPQREAAPAPRQPGPQRTPRDPESKLSAMESRILEFEARWWRASGAKTQAIADELELTPERYYQHLARLIDHPEAAAEQPAVVRRLRAARDERRAAR